VLGPFHLLVRLGLIALVASATAQAQTQSPPDARPVFLVTDVVVGEGAPVDKETVRDVLATRFGRLKSLLDVRSMAEARASIDAAALAQLTGSGSDEDLARIEQYVQVDRLVLGRVGVVGGVVDLQVKLFNAREGVTEVAFARRLGKDADRAVTLALLDALADSLLAWTVEHYTGGEMSAEAAALKARRFDKKKPTPPAATSPWGTMGIVGAAATGLGVGVLGAGVAGGVLDGDFGGVDIGMVGGGAAALVLGATALAIDLGNGAE
jgi:hypothetical protein